MEIIINERWNYQLIKNEEKYILSVMCGTVGLYEIEIAPAFNQKGGGIQYEFGFKMKTLIKIGYLKEI